MRRNALLILMIFVLALVAAACTDDEPSDLSGCEQPEGVAEADVYTNENGCVHGAKKPVEHGAAEEHGTEGESEGEHTEEGDAAEGEHSEEESSETDHAEGEATAEAEHSEGEAAPTAEATEASN